MVVTDNLRDRPMRVCYLTEADLSINNGRGINEREFVDSAFESSVLDFRCVAPEPAEPDNYRNISIDYVPSHNHNGFGYLRFAWWAYRRIAALHRDVGLDGFATRLDVTPLVAYTVQRRLQLPVLLKMLVLKESFAKVDRWPSRPSEFAKRVFRPLFRTVVENAVAADTPSRVLVEELRHTFGFTDENLILIRNGANLEQFRLGRRTQDRRGLGLDRFRTLVGYVGILGGKRHLELLLRAFAKATRDGNSGFGLVLVGEGPQREDLEKLVDRLGIEDRVVFTGQVPYEKVPEYMRCFDVGIDLSATPVRYTEVKQYISYSQKTAQYLGSGCPVIGWQLRDFQFLDQAGVGWTVPFDNADALASVLKEIGSANAEEQEKIRQRAHRFAEEHLAASELTRRRLEYWAKHLTIRDGR